MKIFNIVLILFIVMLLTSCNPLEFRDDEVYNSYGRPYFENNELKIDVTIINGYFTQREMEYLVIEIELRPASMQEIDNYILAKQTFLVSESLESRTRSKFTLIFDNDNLNYTIEELIELEISDVNDEGITRVRTEISTISQKD